MPPIYLIFLASNNHNENIDLQNEIIVPMFPLPFNAIPPHPSTTDSFHIDHTKHIYEP